MIFLELVPRHLDTLIANSCKFLNQFDALTGINIPDVKRIDIRSYTATEALLAQNITAIPHIRTQDDSITNHLNRLSQLYTNGLRHVLFISGDVIKNHNDSGVRPLELIRETKAALPDLQVYAGVDPYRQSFEAECEYASQKLEAGADGLFSQPFFDTKLLTIYLNTFSHTAFFCGVSPVTSPKSKTYWETVNHVTFVDSFECTLEYHAQLGKDLLAASKQFNQHAYLMPIRTPVETYLTLLFS